VSEPPPTSDPSPLPLGTRLRRFPARLWAASGEAAGSLTDGFRRRPSKWTLRLIRFALLLVLIVMAPFAILVGARARRGTSATDALYRRVTERWQTDPLAAAELVRETYDALTAHGGIATFSAIEVRPYGKFQFGDAVWVHRFLYDCEMRLGRYEQALAVARSLPGRVSSNVLMQVDCLVALGRNDEAIAVLEQNLDLDGWRGELRIRRDELERARGLRVV